MIYKIGKSGYGFLNLKNAKQRSSPFSIAVAKRPETPTVQFVLYFVCTAVRLIENNVSEKKFQIFAPRFLSYSGIHHPRRPVCRLLEPESPPFNASGPALSFVLVPVITPSTSVLEATTGLISTNLAHVEEEWLILCFI